MKEKDEIADLFHSKLSNHAEHVDPALWSKVQAGLKASSISASGAVAGKSIGVIKTLIIASGMAIVTGTVAVWVLKKDTQKTQGALTPTSQNDPTSNQESPSLTTQSQTTIEAPKSEVVNNKTAGKEPTQETENTEYQEKDDEIALEPTPNTTFKNLPDIRVVDQPENTVQQNKREDKPSTENQSESSAASPNPKNEHSSLIINTIPNIFTPNSDGKNDLFSIPVADGVSHSTKIFNSKGDLVASFDEKSMGWDGTVLGGNEAANGTYFYVTFVSDSHGNEQQFKGPIHLKR